MENFGDCGQSLCRECHGEGNKADAAVGGGLVRAVHALHDTADVEFRARIFCGTAVAAAVPLGSEFAFGQRACGGE